MANPWCPHALQTQALTDHSTFIRCKIYWSITQVAVLPLAVIFYSPLWGSSVQVNWKSLVGVFLLLQEERELPKIVTLCKALDDVLRGGIALQAITEVSGLPGLGKTQMWYASPVTPQWKVIFISFCVVCFCLFFCFCFISISFMSLLILWFFGDFYSLQACVSVQLPQVVGGLGGEAVYVDTEGAFTAKRLRGK